VLVDLQGHTRGQRLAIAAYRPAPVQASYLGFAGTTGAPYIDYLICDPYVTPLTLEDQYTEKLAQLPLCFQPNGRWRPLPQPMARAEAGLPDDAFVMCAFNHTYKIGPEAFDAWCAVMREVPHAVLWLKETNKQLKPQVLQQAADRGVAPERILFAQNVEFADHFSRLALADVFVDTWPYNAHTTASDALWAGVPVVTVYQNSYVSRVAASALNAIGLPELAFSTVDDYVMAIRTLASDPVLLADLRRHLNAVRMTTPLFDPALRADELEALYRRMVERSRGGLAPEHLLA
jgi:predicted O-linked N-acetylglucosamine transferase (SPINDLY family)